MNLLSLPKDWQGESAEFLEGAILASNLAVKPLAPEQWCVLIGIDASEATQLLVPHINQQHNILQRSEYTTDGLKEESLADFSEGFMTVWPTIEEQYQSVSLNDGTLRMLQALLTTFMLAIDEEQTHKEMRSAGIEQPPYLEDMRPQLDSMIMEVALAADELMVGGKAQNINPYKKVGRNDQCPCGSGKKFKQCCAN